MISFWIRAFALPLILVVFFIPDVARSQDAGSPPKPKPLPHALLGAMEFKGKSLKVVPQWLRVRARIESERGIYAACRENAEKCPSSAVASWQAMIKSVKGLAPREQVDKVNRFINKWPYRTDIENYGVADYWADPLQFIRRSGDCEDYAITKYVTFRQLGFSASNLRIVVVRDTLRRLAHAVLAVYMKDSILILDSLFNDVLPDTEFFSLYVPQYSLNETSIWVHVMPISPKRDKFGGKVK